MILNADEQGCVAGGRWLRGVSVPAGSNIMTVPAGTVLGVDVGASASIPGAADMHTTIDALPGAKEMTSVAIAVNTHNLMVKLTMDRFVTNIHNGWRITIDGAGPNGTPLVTGIAVVGQVSDGVQVLTLDDSASTAVAFADPPDPEVPVAVANDGVRARLRDHARASVGPLQVAIRDRHVADAAMTVGSHILRSDAARFSRLDLNTAVTIESAGHHVTTVQEVPGDTTVVLADPAHRTVSDGPADVWRPESDSTPHLLKMLESAGQTPSDPVEIVFGPGVYDFTCTHQEKALPAAIRLENLDGVTLRGSGRGVTILRLMPEQDLQGNGLVVKDTHVIMARNCHDLTITKLTVHGAYLTMAKGGVVQMHGVFLAAGCEDVGLIDIEVFQSGGDGVRLLGNVDCRLQAVRVDRCRLIQNHRSGVAIQREVAKVRIHGCSIDMTPPGEDACIDLEPTGKQPAEAPNDIEIDSNTLVHGNRAMAVSLSGIDAERPARLVRFRDNTVTGGRVGGTYTESLSVLRNVIDAADADVTGSLMGFNNRCVDLHVEGNQILAAGQEAGGITLTGRNGAGQVRIVANVVRTAGLGIDVTVSGSDVEVARNEVRGDGQRPGIRVRTTGGTPHEDVTVSDNVVLEFGRAGITVGPDDVPDALHQAQITGNTIDREEEPIPPGLIGIELIGGEGQWINRVVGDNQIGAAIPVAIHGPT